MQTAYMYNPKRKTPIMWFFQSITEDEIFNSLTTKNACNVFTPVYDSVYWEVSALGVSVQGVLCLGRSLSRGGSVWRVSVHGVSVQGGVSVWGTSLSGRPPTTVRLHGVDTHTTGMHSCLTSIFWVYHWCLSLLLFTDLNYRKTGTYNAK